MSEHIDAKRLRQHLDHHDKRRIFEASGFELEGRKPNSSGWINGMMGPGELGEGTHGNFAVNLESGFAKDHGSSGFEGDIFDVVQKVHNLSFPETLKWIVDLLGIDPAKVAAPSANGSASRSQKDDSSSEPGSSSSASKTDADRPVASTSEVRSWNKELLDADHSPAKVALNYLVETRGISREILVKAHGGLAHSSKLPARVGRGHPGTQEDVDWWIVIPILNESREKVIALKLFAFDPEDGEWQRNNDGDKLAKNVGSAVLWDLTHLGPDRNTLLVVEGEIDALSASSNGFDVVTGTGGAGTWKQSMTDRVAEKDREVVVCYDADEAGKEGATKVASALYEAGAQVKVASLPEGHDVNDLLLERGREGLEQCIEAATPYTRSKNEGRPSGESPEEGPARPGPLPDRVYELLPPILHESTDFFQRQHERDVFLTASLGALSSVMPNVGGYYGEVPRWLGPNFYVAIVAGAAGGKGVQSFAKKMVKTVDSKITEKYEEDLKRWEKRKKEAEKNNEDFDEPEPQEQSLILPANTSAASLYEGLKNRGSRALLMESEIDTLTDALGQEWGKFDSTLRKAFHHETDSYRRKGEDGNVRLEHPHISIVLSGTPGQFRRLMGSAENGLYSRFALYFFEAPAYWVSQRPSAKAIEMVEEFETNFATPVLSLWERLRDRDSDLEFSLTGEQWSQRRKRFNHLLKQLYAYGREDLDDVIKRAGVIAFRVAMISAVLRLHHDRPSVLTRADEVEASEQDFLLGMELATTWAEHAVWFANDYLASGDSANPQIRRIGVMLNNLGNEFASSEAYEVARANGVDVSQRQLLDDLKAAARKGYIRPGTKRSRWEKLS